MTGFGEQLAPIDAPPPDEAAAAARAPSDFRVEVAQRADEAVAAAFGEIDLATADELQRPVVDLLESGVRCVVVDLSGVTFVDSTGIHALIVAHRRAQELEARMPVVLGNEATRRVFDLAGLGEYFEVRDAAHP